MGKKGRRRSTLEGKQRWSRLLASAGRGGGGEAVVVSLGGGGEVEALAEREERRMRVGEKEGRVGRFLDGKRKKNGREREK